MYDTILLTLDTSPTDRPIIEHIKVLAGLLHSRVILLHVATGVPAQLGGPDAGGEEIEKVGPIWRASVPNSRRSATGTSGTRLRGSGSRNREVGRRGGCDLLAMGTHGHGIVGDLFLGVTRGAAQYQCAGPHAQVALKIGRAGHFAYAP